MTRRPRISPFVLVLLLVLPAAVAQEGATGGVLVRVEGDVTVGPNETIETLVVVGPDARADVAGTVGVLVVVDGALELRGTVVDRLVLVGGHAILHNGSHVQGDISVIDGTLDRHPDARVDGHIDDGGMAWVGPLAAFVLGAIFLVGVPLALVVGALVAVMLFPHQVRTVGATLTRSTGPSVLTALLTWLVLPLVAFVLFFTLVGIPLALGILFILLPLLWILGFIVVGVRLGDLMLSGWGKRPLGTHPYLASLLGMLLLILLGLLPIVGGVLVVLAGMVGAGAFLVAAWRSARPRRRRGRPPEPPATRAAAEGAPWDPGAGGA